jgi:hypothetical protein
MSLWASHLGCHLCHLVYEGGMEDDREIDKYKGIKEKG